MKCSVSVCVCMPLVGITSLTALAPIVVARVTLAAGMTAMHIVGVHMLIRRYVCVYVCMSVCP